MVNADKHKSDQTDKNCIKFKNKRLKSIASQLNLGNEDKEMGETNDNKIELNLMLKLSPSELLSDEFKAYFTPKSPHFSIFNEYYSTLEKLNFIGIKENGPLIDKFLKSSIVNSPFPDKGKSDSFLSNHMMMSYYDRFNSIKGNVDKILKDIDPINNDFSANVNALVEDSNNIKEAVSDESKKLGKLIDLKEAVNYDNVKLNHFLNEKDASRNYLVKISEIIHDLKLLNETVELTNEVRHLFLYEVMDDIEPYKGSKDYDSLANLINYTDKYLKDNIDASPIDYKNLKLYLSDLIYHYEKNDFLGMSELGKNFPLIIEDIKNNLNDTSKKFDNAKSIHSWDDILSNIDIDRSWIIQMVRREDRVE